MHRKRSQTHSEDPGVHVRVWVDDRNAKITSMHENQVKCSEPAWQQRIENKAMYKWSVKIIHTHEGVN